MTYFGPERRKHVRISNAHFVVSYRIFEESDNTDVSQTKNLSLGGMLLTTNREFQPGTNLALEIRLPFDPNPIMLVGKVLDSRQIIKDLLYDTRLEFLAVDENHRKVIVKTVEHYLKKG
jgi:c-di-GMP-binding flagellar brake protein YcgR